MKHFHMLAAFITIALFLWQSYLKLSSDQHASKPIKIAAHIFYALVILTGALTLMPLLSVNAPLQWVAAKVILLIAAISASIKAFRPTTTKSQSKIGIFIAFVAYMGILILAFVKPGNFI